MSRSFVAIVGVGIKNDLYVPITLLGLITARKLWP
jgi:hypothetical protein